MSVVYLPEDKRWTMVGQGLGSLVGAFVSRKLIDSDNQRVLQGIHDINSDESIQPQDKPYVIGERLGMKGLALKQSLDKQALQGITQAHTEAETDLARSRNVQVQQQTKQQAQMSPLQQQEAEGRVKQQPLTAANTASEIAAREAKTGPEVQNLQLTGQKTAQELADQKTQRDQLIRLYAADPDATATQMGMTKEALHNTLVAGALAGPKAAAGVIEAQTRTDTAAGQVGPRETAKIEAQNKAKAGTKPLENVDRQQVANAASLSEDMGSVLKSIENDPKAQGGISGYFKQLLTSHGYGMDPAFTSLVAAAHQQVQTAATSGSGFTGKTRVDLAKDVSPTVIKDKIQQIMDVNQYLHNQTARLESIRTEYAKDPQRNLEAIDDSISKLKSQTGVTDTLWYTKDGKAIFYRGRQINPKTFEPVKDGAKELTGQSVDIGNGNTATGQQLNDFARIYGVTPDQAVAVSKTLQGPEHGTLRQTIEKITGVKRPDLEGK